MRFSFLLPALFVAGTAHATAPQPPPVYDGSFAPCGDGVAADDIVDVPDEQPTLALGVAAAPPGGIVRLAPGTHRIEQPIEVRKALTICALYPPREVYDGPNADIIDDTILEQDIDAVFDNPDFNGSIVVKQNRVLTFRNITFKLPELLCTDNQDNDGNGLVDDEDPFCVGLLALETGEIDTGGGITFNEVIFGPQFKELRAFLVENNAELTVEASEIQGWSVGVEGNAINANNPSRITVRNSRFVSNLGTLDVTDSGTFIRSRGGAIYTRAGEIRLENNAFIQNRERYGGALYATDGAIIVADNNAFDRNAAEDGGALFIESSTLLATRNFFVENTANAVPKRRLYNTYEGGAIYAEDSSVELFNNVFLSNGGFDWGASVFIRRNFNGVTPPRLVNNTFVSNEPGLLGGASVMFDETTFDYRNNISFDEGSGVIGAQNWELGSVPEVEYNMFFGVPTDGIFTADLSGLAINQSVNYFANPLFVYFVEDVHNDWRLWRFWLDQLSPAINAGDPAEEYNDVGGSRNDIGRYGGAAAGTQDVDGDGWTNIYDCDDEDPTRFPYAFEDCDNEDNDCNGIEDDRETRWYVDIDRDGYGVSDDPTNPPIDACPEDQLPPLSQGVYTQLGGDCDDTSSLVNPGRVEFCDQTDNDCDGEIDEGIIAKPYYVDVDGDGFGAPDPTRVQTFRCPPEGFSPFSNDCNDNNPNIHPLITSEARTHQPLADEPIERHEADRNPAYVADGIDQDCDSVDLCYPDDDRDGFGEAPQPGAEQRYVEDNDRNCRNLSSFTAANNTDCDDGDDRAYLGAPEIPGDLLDQDCDGFDDCYEDKDGDGYGTEVVITDNDLDCGNDSAPTAPEPDDCDDDPATGAQINPGAAEQCDGVDNNCDGVIDDENSPGATAFYRDADGDGYGDVTSLIRACGNPAGYVTNNEDCDDSNPQAFPGNVEVCDGIDNNCRDGVDESTAEGVFKWYEDLDQDGYGNANLVEESCTEPEFGGPWVRAGKQLDCDDDDPQTGPCPDCGCNAQGGSTGALPVIGSLLGLALLRRRRRG